MINFNFSQKGLGLVTSPHFGYDFSRKIFLMLQLTRFHCRIAFTSQNIGQYVYYNCLLTRLGRHKI